MKIITVGRSAENNIILFDDKVSGKHASLTLTNNNEFYVQDFNSTNGTFVNDHKISNEPFRLMPQDIVKVGQTVIPWQTYLSEEFKPQNIFEDNKPEMNKEKLKN